MGVIISEKEWEQNNDSHKVVLSIFSTTEIDDKQAYSDEYELDRKKGSVVFQVMIYEIENYKVQLLIKFAKNEQNDKRTYKIEFNHRIKDDAGATHATVIADDSTWRLIYHELSIPNKFTATFKVIAVTGYQGKYLPLKPHATLHEDTELIDFQLRGVDGSVHLHKAIAAAASPVLRRMFAGDWRETAEGVVEVPDTTKVTLQHFKDYIYLDTTPDNGVEELLLLASFYMMPDLEQRCVSKLKHSVTTETASDLIIFAANNRLQKLVFAILEQVQNGSLDVNKVRSYHST